MATKYVTVRMTARQAYAVANAAQDETYSRLEDEGMSKPDREARMVEAGCQALLDAWRRAGASYYNAAR